MASIPLVLVARNPQVKTLKDFSDKDKIAVPTVKVSMQATVLQMASEKTFRPGQEHKLDHLTVILGHPDAAVSLINGKGDIDSHFSAPPYRQKKLASPGVH